MNRHAPNTTAAPLPDRIASLHALDTEFLLLEDADSPMYIGSLCIFEGPVPSRSECEHFVASRLDLVPAYRKRLRAVPLGLGRPALLDDIDFDLDYHLRRVILDAPDDAALWELLATLMSTPLDRRRPLWQLFVVEGLRDQRWAMITKVHHALVDGVAGIGVLAAVLSDRPDAKPVEHSAWQPMPQPTRRELVANALVGLGRDASAWTSQLRAATSQPRAALARARDLGAGLYQYVRSSIAHKTSSLQGRVRGRRRYACVRVQLEDVQAIRRACGCTVNDVVLALLSGGYRALLELRGDDLSRVRLRSLVPVSVRSDGAHGNEGNRVSAMICELPVVNEDPHVRLDAIARSTKRAKASHMIEAGVWFTELGDLAPPQLVGLVSRAIAHGMHWLPQNTFSTVTTNVPGPNVPLYFRGRRMLSWSPFVPITQGARIGSAVLSYNGTLAFGVTADADSVSHLDVFLRAVTADLAALLARARVTTRNSTVEAAS